MSSDGDSAFPRPSDRASALGVSYIMPVLNEREHLESAVRAVLGQEYAGPQEIILALAPSDDGTDEIAVRLADEDPRIVIAHNPERDIPIGLNLAVEASSHPIIIRVDAHSELAPLYTQHAVASLVRHGADNVGGIMRAQGTSPVQRAIARGYNTPYGLGGGAYHGDGQPQRAESAYLGVFWREAFDRIGGFDPEIRRGEDWEFNLRLRKAGGEVWFDPVLRVVYWPRPRFTALSQQFFATGAWRAVLVKKYPREHPWRFFAPGALLIGLVTSAIVAMLQVIGAVSGSVSWWISVVHLAPLGYTAAVCFAAGAMGARGLREWTLNLVTLAVMHLSWGAGFLVGLVRGARRTVDRSRAASPAA